MSDMQALAGVLEGTVGSPVDDIDLRLAEVESEIQTRGRRLRNWVIVASALALTGILLVILGTKSSAGGRMFESEQALIGFSMAMYSILGGVLTGFFGQRKLSALRHEATVLSAKKRILTRGAPSGAPAADSNASYFDRLVDINLTNLGAYYGLVKIHAGNGFIVATAAAAVGFALVILGLLVGLFLGDSARASHISYMAAGSGVITEFVAGIFFYLYNKTVQQLKEYHDSLLAVQDVLLSFKLVGDTPDPQEKAKMVGQMLTYLVGKRSLTQKYPGEVAAGS